jgi:hypothetical protein
VMRRLTITSPSLHLITVNVTVQPQNYIIHSLASYFLRQMLDKFYVRR